MTKTPVKEAISPTSTPLTVSDEALTVVLEARAAEDDPANTALRVAITGANMSDYIYELELVSTSEAADDDLQYRQGSHDELTLIIPTASASKMQGATLDISQVGNAGGLVIRNPNNPDPLDGLDLDPDAPLADKVSALLDNAINPMLDSHGGYATLVSVEADNSVKITMGGGCQGCAASAMTLREGIKKMLMDSLEEITDVIDATDHDEGENPYFT